MPNKRSLGLSLIETSLVVSMVAAIIIGLWIMYDNSIAELNNLGTANQLNQVLNAASEYVQLNGATLFHHQAQTQEITFAELQQASLLPVESNNNTLRGQQIVILTKPSWVNNQINSAIVLLVTQQGRPLSSNQIGSINNELPGHGVTLKQGKLIANKATWTDSAANWYQDAFDQTVVKKLLTTTGHLAAYNIVTFKGKGVSLDPLYYALYQNNQLQPVVATGQPIRWQPNLDFNSHDHLTLYWHKQNISKIEVKTSGLNDTDITLQSANHLTLYPDITWRNHSFNLRITLTPYNQYNQQGEPTTISVAVTS